VVNAEPTHADDKAELGLRGNVAEVLGYLEIRV
jgi:hypothetical protein